MIEQRTLDLRLCQKLRRKPEVPNCSSVFICQSIDTFAVAGVFSNVAASYDTMNDFMSLGIHRLWKYVLICTKQLSVTV